MIFTIPVKITNVFSSSEMRYNGIEVYNKASDMLLSGKTAEAYDYLLSVLSDDLIYYVKNFEKFRFKVGWWVFGTIQFRVPGGKLISVSVTNRSKRMEMFEMYRNYVQ